MATWSRARVIQADSPISYLQQRLNYAEQMAKPPLYMLENVPVWPPGALPFLELRAQAVTHYANCQGQHALLDMLCQREQQKYGLHLRPEHLLISNGAFHAISLITQYLYRPGARILCQTPLLESVDKILKMQGYDIIYCTPAADESLLNAIQRCCEHEPIDLLYLNVPHNPSGAVMAVEEMQALTELVKQRDLPLLADLVYDAYLFNDQPCGSPLMFNTDWRNLYVVNSMSKSYGAPGLRIGWTISAPENIALLTSHLEAECIAVCTASQEQAIALLQHGNHELVAQVKTNWAYVKTALPHLAEVQFTVPAGGTQYFPQLPVNDIEAFADFMLINFGVVLVTSGNYVGLNTPHIRIPLGMTQAEVEHAIALLTEGLQVW